MHPKEAIKVFKSELDWAEQNRYPYVSENKIKAIKLAIQALETQGDVFDKIRLEIEKLNPVDYGSMYSYESHNGARDMKHDVLEIIDEYRKGGAE